MAGTHPGATWRLTDLQCHTPRDVGWVGEPRLPASTEAEDAARHDWARTFVAAAKERGLSLVAITDHHDVVMARYVREAALHDEELVVLAGVEITCSDGVQVLALFDPSTEPEVWGRLLHNLSGTTPTDAAAARVAGLTHCGLEVRELFEKVANDATLAPVTMLVPRFGPETAHKTLNVAGHAPRAKTLSHDCVYVECRYEDVDRGTLDKIQGRVPDWGDRRRAIIATGDNKHPNWNRLGAHPCWIKMGENTLEALRQAFFADDTRISFQRPQHPTEHIEPPRDS